MWVAWVMMLASLDARLAEQRGKIVVLNFWATWCQPCLQEMPLLEAIHEQYASRGVEVIGASADDASTRGRIPEFTRRVGVRFPIWEGATTADMHALGLPESLPGTALIDRDGSVAFRIHGIVKKKDLKDRIDWLLSDRAKPPPVDREEEEHTHATVGMEGASLVPS